ncbi:MAG: hypothetical protein KGI55_04510 [Gammaproteobacteria bacterium]|nr:hypothetical protein [Gammaproteobacteria bacterium]
MLLISTQQGAMVHEFGHLFGATRAESRVSAPAGADAACPFCAEFAQVVAPAFSHAFAMPALVLAQPELGIDAAHSAITAAVPTPRSRGPPSSN